MVIRLITNRSKHYGLRQMHWIVPICRYQHSVLFYKSRERRHFSSEHMDFNFEPDICSTNSTHVQLPTECMWIANSTSWRLGNRKGRRETEHNNSLWVRLTNTFQSVPWDVLMIIKRWQLTYHITCISWLMPCQQWWLVYLAISPNEVQMFIDNNISEQEMSNSSPCH